jgi:hypothetical protein
MLKFRCQTGLVLFVLLTAFWFWSAPWSALECGPDEGIEFSKMQLLLQHPEMAKLAWNDQSWFYSQVFAAIFSVTGFQCGIPRLATLVIVGCILFSFPRLMPGNAGWPHVIFAWLFFWCWPDMPQLTVSAMLEVPAIGLAIIATATTPRNREEWKCWRFGCAGILFAVAVQVKLTALIILPALAAKIIYIWWREIYCQPDIEKPTPSVNSNSFWLPPAFGCAVFAMVFILIAAWSPDWDWSQLWKSHLAAGKTFQADEYRLEPEELLQSPGTLVAALLGILVLWRKRRLHEAAFSLVLLVTVFIIHFNHRPWWYYYGIHFAIPFALLGGWGAAELFQVGIRNLFSGKVVAEPVFSRENSMMLAALVICLWSGFELSRGYEDTLLVSQEERSKDDEALNQIKQYRVRVKWAFTRRNILTAQAGYAIPPEITILPLKRFWTGKITDNVILETVKHYQCEILILYSDRDLKENAWNQFVKNEYVKVWSEENEFIFVAKRLNPAPEPNRENLLKQLGL